MKNLFTILVLKLLFTQFGFAQKIVEKNERFGIDIKQMTELRKLKYAHEIKFYLGKDKQTIAAEQKGKILWVKNIIRMCGKPLVGKSKVRKIWIKDNSVVLVYGKHFFAKINIISGYETCLGSD
ncbi:hypothetical protein QWY90_04260 [Flavobacterium paronense]|uniref:Uncharacterized protein n=1 Tax=Flavobacterium paronense TaxID=1392775 RepID=A0ABV5GH88_9FLAO|nr:hypothetical protein [Flavobacterium paronense]MDN3676519.1 hypothetical protein [Flavobacterium paronense]